MSAKPDKPSAEYWLGTHPNAPSRVVDETGERDLAEVLRELRQPALPFLLKILDVRMMLSIQVHPTIPQAEDGYAREDAAGIPLLAGKRTYKDRNHKPELMFALGRFWMLHGLRSKAEIMEELSRRPSCRPLKDILVDSGIKELVAAVLDDNNSQIRSVTEDLLREIDSSGK